MPEERFEAGEEPPEAEFDELPPEVPEADALEQHEDASGDYVGEGPRDLPFDASEADALDQRREVPYEDDSED